MLVTSKEMLEKAYREKYAVVAINTQGGTFDIIRAICMAAEEMKAPVILAHYLSTGQYSGDDWFFQTAYWWANKVRVPVAIHLDHGNSFEECIRMIRQGFTSIMYDGSCYDIEENALKTNEVLKVAHAVSVPVEAEVGELARYDENGNAAGGSNMTKPQDVERFLHLCQPDSLAIGIGNAHGFYQQKVDIRVDILKECRELTDIPFVLHGCTGMSTDLIQESIQYGVAKINFGTQIRYNYVKYLREGLDRDIQGHAWKLSQYASNRLIEDVKDIILLSGSQNKY
ncbi:MAG: class II fructose-bisphosphate aldolase [Eubacteriales bacterium]|nr:class II fructose-bisphosphate aldolase [Eubacteriales bacterium]